MILWIKSYFRCSRKKFPWMLSKAITAFNITHLTVLMFSVISCRSSIIVVKWFLWIFIFFFLFLLFSFVLLPPRLYRIIHIYIPFTSHNICIMLTFFRFMTSQLLQMSTQNMFSFFFRYYILLLFYWMLLHHRRTS